MITLVGIGHVFQLRPAVKALIESRGPDLVCVELDQVRFKVLMERARGGPPPSFTYSMLARFQERIAGMYGTTVGDEMVTAVETAQELGVPVALIDMDAMTMITRLRAQMTVKERVWLFFASLGSLFVTKRRIEKEMSQYESDPEAYHEALEKRFPTINRVLIDERNMFMSRQIQSRTEEYADIVVVIGDGHIRGISQNLEGMGLDHEVVRLSEMRHQPPLDTPNAGPPEGATSPSEEPDVTYSFTVNSQ